MQYLEVEINFNTLSPSEQYEFRAAIASGRTAVKLIPVQITDRDNLCFYARISNQENIDRILREVYLVRGLMDIKKIINHVPGSISDLYHLELIVSIEKGKKYFSNTYIPPAMNDHHNFDTRAIHHRPNNKIRYDPNFMGGVDPWLPDFVRPVNTAPKLKSKKILLLM